MGLFTNRVCSFNILVDTIWYQEFLMVLFMVKIPMRFRNCSESSLTLIMASSFQATESMPDTVISVFHTLSHFNSLYKRMLIIHILQIDLEMSLSHPRSHSVSDSKHQVSNHFAILRLTKYSRYMYVVFQVSRDLTSLPWPLQHSKKLLLHFSHLPSAPSTGTQALELLYLGEEKKRYQIKLDRKSVV